MPPGARAGRNGMRAGQGTGGRAIRDAAERAARVLSGRRTGRSRYRPGPVGGRPEARGCGMAHGRPAETGRGDAAQGRGQPVVPFGAVRGRVPQI